MASSKTGKSEENIELERKLLAEIGAEIVKNLAGTFFEVDGSPTATVKYDTDGVITYKKRVLLPTWNFVLEYTYVGKSGNLIFGMSPEDAQEYTHAELPVKEMDNAFPLFGAAVATLYGKESENLAVIVAEVLAEKFQQHLEKIEQEKAQSIAALSSNELYGRF